MERQKIKWGNESVLNLFDSHTHSDNSPDGAHSVTFMCEKAVENGLMGFSVTDHCDIDQYKEDSFELRVIQSVFETRKAQMYFGELLTLTCGIELGQPLSDVEFAQRALELHNFDFALGSVHAVRGERDFCFQDFTACAPGVIQKKMSDYFDEVLATVRWGGFDVLAHLTYPLRYIMGRDGVACDIKPFREQIDAILYALIEQGKGLELNVSGLYGSYGRTMPERDVMRRFKELGGEIVTVGSDAHRAESIGYCIADGMEILQECGFDYFAFYKKRAPRMLPIR